MQLENRTQKTGSK